MRPQLEVRMDLALIGLEKYFSECAFLTANVLFPA